MNLPGILLDRFGSSQRIGQAVMVAGSECRCQCWLSEIGIDQAHGARHTFRKNLRRMRTDAAAAAARIDRGKHNDPALFTLALQEKNALHQSEHLLTRCAVQICWTQGRKYRPILGFCPSLRPNARREWNLDAPGTCSRELEPCLLQQLKISTHRFAPELLFETERPSAFVGGNGIRTG